MATTTRTCTGCGQRHLIELQMTVKTGPVLTMLSCSACETRSWLVDGESAPVDAVLAAAAGDDSFVLTPSSRRVLSEQAASPPARRRRR